MGDMAEVFREIDCANKERKTNKFNEVIIMLDKRKIHYSVPTDNTIKLKNKYNMTIMIYPGSSLVKIRNERFIFHSIHNLLGYLFQNNVPIAMVSKD